MTSGYVCPRCLSRPTLPPVVQPGRRECAGCGWSFNPAEALPGAQAHAIKARWMPTARARKILRGECFAVSVTRGRPEYARVHLEHVRTGRTLTLEGAHWSETDPERLEDIGLAIMWHVIRRGCPPPQAARLVELERVMRKYHGDGVRRRGSRLTVEGSNIAARVEPDGGAWQTWADGSRTYDLPNPPANLED